ncbi:mucin-5AC-like isoform X2 [Biomphalaria glabrata]|uniref:Mucin-5AC-like isoform X2 n=1 Tax=Biomphalaria glabrata TaxID=6526 RepID=A0A9W3BP52_BIOGL|nr:mucin-5AC-like isoform X2 [Biomphalaria glabrata]
MAEEDDRGMALKVQMEELGPEVAELLESVNGAGVDREAVVVQIVQDVFVTEHSRSEPDPASSCTEASGETDYPSLDELQQDTSESAKENNPAPTRYRPLVPKSQSLALKFAKMQLSKKVNSISARLAHADHPKRNPESKFYRPTFRSRRLPEPIPLPSRDSSTASSSADADKEQDPAATSREEASAPTSKEEASAITSKEAHAATSREHPSAPTSQTTGNSNLDRIGNDAIGSTSKNPWLSISSAPGPSVATNSYGKASEAPAPAGPPVDSVSGTSVSPSSDIDASDDPRSQSVITFFPRPGLPEFVTSPSASNRQRDLSPLKVPRTTHARPIGTERTACPLPFFPTLGVPETIPSQPTMTTDTSNVSATWPSVIPCQENVPINPASVTSGQASLSSSDNAVSRAVDHPDRQTIDSGQGYYEPPFYEITDTTYSIPAVGSDQSHVTTNPTLVISGPMHQASLISSDYAVPRALDHPDRQSNESSQDYYVTQFYDNRDSTQSMAAVDSDERQVTTYPTLVTSGPMHQASMISSDYAVPRALDHPDRQSIESGQGYYVPPYYDNRDSTHSMAAVDSDQRHGLRQQELLSSSDISDPIVQVHPDGQSGQAGYLPSFYDNIDHSTPVVSSDQIENIPRNTSLVIYEPRQAQRNVLLAQYNPGAEANPNWQPGNTQEYIPVSPYHSGYTTTMPTVGTGHYVPTNLPYAIPIRPMVSPFHHFPRPQFIWPTVDPSQQRSVALMPSVHPANIQHVSHVWPANASGQIVMVPTGSSSVISDPSHAPTSFSSAPPVQRQVTANTSAETPHEVYPMMPSPTSSSSSEQSQASMASVSGADSTPTLRWNRMSLDFESRITRIRGPFPHYPYETLPEIIQRINSRGLDASSEEIAELQTATFIDHEMFKSMLSGNPAAIGYYQRSYQAMETPTSGIFDYPDRPPLRFCNNEAVIDISKAIPEFFVSDRNEQRARTRRQTSSAGRNQASRQAYGSTRQVRPRSLRHSRSNTQPTLPSSDEARVDSEEANPESMQDAREQHVQTTVGPEPEAAALERMQLLQSLSARNKETHTQLQTKIKYQSSQTRRAASRQTVSESSVGAQNKRHEKIWTPRYQNKANTGSSERTGRSGKTTKTSSQTAEYSSQTAGNSAQTDGSSAQTSESSAQTSGSVAQTSGSAAQTSESSGQTSESSAQTAGSSAQTSGSSALTDESSSPTTGSSAQRTGSATQTTGSAAQTTGSAAPMTGSAAPTTVSSAQTSESSAQTSGSAAQTSESAAQTSGSAAQTSGSAGQTSGRTGKTSGISAQTSGSSAKTSGSTAQTSGSSAQTSGSTAQTSGSSAQTSRSAAQTSGSAAQTSESSGQTSGSSAQTSGSSAQTSGSSAQTSGSSAQTSGSSAQTSGSSAQTSGSSAQISESSGQTSKSSAQTSGSSAQTSGSSAQTSGSSAQTSGSSAQTSGSSAQTSGSSAQTSGSSAQTSGKAGKTSGRTGKTSGKVGKTSGKAGKTSGRTGKTSGSTAQTENPNPPETEQRVTPVLASNPQRVTPAPASNPQRVTPALASNPQRVTSALSSSSSEFTASASWRPRGQSQKLGSTSRQGHTRHRHRHEEVGRSSTDLENSDEERPESPTMDQAFSQAYTESRDAASEIIDEFNYIFDPIFCWFERRSPFPCNRSREGSQTAESAGVEARSPESEQAFLKHYLMQVVRAIQNPPMTCQLSDFLTTELMEIRLRLFARRAQLRAARASVRFDSLGLHRLAETFRTFADPLVAPITGLDSRVYVWQCQCGGQHEVPHPSPEQETEYCDIIVEFLNYESVITEAIIYVEREIMHRGLTQPITVTTNELGFSSRARGYVEVEWMRIFRNIGIEIGSRREAMMTRLVQPIARLHEYQRIFRSRGMAPPGLTNSELSQIPVVQHADASSQCESTSAYECSICLKSYRPRDEVRVLPCGHRFHRKCIDTWLKKTCSCPMCRKSTRDPNPE